MHAMPPLTKTVYRLYPPKKASFTVDPQKPSIVPATHINDVWFIKMSCFCGIYLIRRSNREKKNENRWRINWSSDLFLDRPLMIPERTIINEQIRLFPSKIEEMSGENGFWSEYFMLLTDRGEVDTKDHENRIGKACYKIDQRAIKSTNFSVSVYCYTEWSSQNVFG